LILAAIVVTLAKTAWAIDAGCDFYQTITAGTTYYVFNSEYPNNYNGSRSCRWYARSATNVRLNCQIFSLPASNNCVRDRVSVSPSGNLQLTDAQNYCGTGTFSVTSTGNNMNIVFTALAGTAGGRFLCSLEATATTTPNCNCGQKKQTRIVGGTSTGVNEYPMMAGIVDLQQRLVYCGGTIISPRHVVCAAHCRLPVSQIAVLVGEHDLNTGADTAATSLYTVSNFVSHPSYNPNTLANDIAVITVTGTIVFSADVGPACLPFLSNSATYVGSQVDVLGWGTLEFAGATSNVLQKVKLEVRPISRCQQIFPDVTNNQLCTYTQGKDACQFDSGGPLLWQNPNTMRLVLCGVISYGQVCADTTPGVNTRVGPYVGWIESVTPGTQYCKVE